MVLWWQQQVTASRKNCNQKLQTCVHNLHQELGGWSKTQEEEEEMEKEEEGVQLQGLFPGQEA